MSPEPLANNTVLGGMRVLKFLGAGGFAITYLVRDEKRGTTYALKEYFPGQICRRGRNQSVLVSSKYKREFSRGLEAFFNEADILRRLPKTKGLLSVRGLFRRNETAYALIEYIDGKPVTNFLSDYFSNGRTIPETIIRDFLFSMTNALAIVHENGLIHCDIKPDNVMMRRSDRHPILIDFGASKSTVATASGGSMYTPNYAAIEQFPHTQGGPSEPMSEGPWTDIYSLSVVTYVMMSGHRVARAADRHKAISAGHPDPYVPIRTRVGDGFSEDLCRLVDNGCKLYPQNRPADARAYFSLIEDARAEETAAYKEHSFFGEAGSAHHVKKNVRQKTPRKFKDSNLASNLTLLFIALTAMITVIFLGNYVLNEIP